MTAKILLIVFACCIFGAGASSAAAPQSLAWIRAFLGTPAGRFRPFEVAAIEFDEQYHHLMGTFRYTNYTEDGKDPLRSVTVIGVHKRDHTFWPVVTTQVSDRTDGPWRTLKAPLLPGRRRPLIIAPKVERDLHISLDHFRPMIGRAKFGRIVLENGQSAIIELADLLPPKTNDESKSE